jgi:molybdenum cofactor cytidylyltransferase
MMLSAIVLAAGMSTRMGQNKLLLVFKGKPLIARAVDTLLASEIDEVIVVLGNEADKVREKLHGRKVRLIENPDFREGLSSSVRVGVTAVSRQADGIMVYLADQPLLEPADVNRILRAFAHAKEAGKSIVVPFFDKQRGNPVLLDSSYQDAILGVVGDVGCKGVIKRYPDQVFVVQMESDHVIRDMDTIEEYEAVLASTMNR